MNFKTVFIVLFCSSSLLFSETEKRDVVINGAKAKVWASSELKGKTPGQYSVENLFDGDLKTAWVEGVDGNGVGEWVTIEFEEEQIIQSVEIINGFQKSNKLFTENNSIKMFDIIIDGKKQSYFSGLEIQLKRNIQINKSVSKIKILISSISKGTKYSDLCISDVNFNNESLSSLPDNLMNKEISEWNIINFKDYSYLVLVNNGLHCLIANRFTPKNEISIQLIENASPKSLFIEDVFIKDNLGFSAIRIVLQNEYERDSYLHFFKENKDQKKIISLLFFHESTFGDEGGFEYKSNIKSLGDSASIEITFIGTCDLPECNDFTPKKIFLFNDYNVSEK